MVKVPILHTQSRRLEQCRVERQREQEGNTPRVDTDLEKQVDQYKCMPDFYYDGADTLTPHLLADTQGAQRKELMKLIRLMQPITNC